MATEEVRKRQFDSYANADQSVLLNKVTNRDEDSSSRAVRNLGHGGGTHTLKAHISKTENSINIWSTNKKCKILRSTFL
ncbi:hypothetical protein B9Z55_005298 [Caenorhabditis nigoni]|uniref:Uncharacterized protein n=1 Tax=Caenorhabditis nigoni TaxID=1611254 RepID=A0A2G5V0A6_9PELO|nr:hypothetical protein B9Z55_005298 [Caenorhabditis nigoni]